MPKIKIMQNMIYSGQTLFPGAVIDVSGQWLAAHTDRHGKPPEQLFCLAEEPPLPAVEPLPVAALLQPEEPAVVVRPAKPRKNR